MKQPQILKMWHIALFFRYYLNICNINITVYNILMNYEKYKNYDQKKINRLFITALRKRDLETVKFTLTSAALSYRADVRLEKSDIFHEVFELACHNDDIAFIDYLIDRPEFQKCRHLAYYALNSVCLKGNLALVRHLVNCETRDFKIGVQNPNILFSAYRSDNLELLKYLLDSPDLPSHPSTDCLNHCLSTMASEEKFDFLSFLLAEKKMDIHLHEDVIVRKAANADNLQLVKYLLTSPDLLEHADFKAAFEGAVINQGTPKNGSNVLHYILENFDVEEHLIALCAARDENPQYFDFKNNQLDLAVFELSIYKEKKVICNITATTNQRSVSKL